MTFAGLAWHLLVVKDGLVKMYQRGAAAALASVPHGKSQVIPASYIGEGDDTRELHQLRFDREHRAKLACPTEALCMASTCSRGPQVHQVKRHALLGSSVILSK